MNFVKLHRKPLIAGDAFPILLNLDDVSGIFPETGGGSVIALRKKQDPGNYTDPGFFSMTETPEETQKIITALQGSVSSKDNEAPLTISQSIDRLYPDREARADG